ncbi:hypothetical protein CYMTET_20890 [Cymbomonas tetramitiformis]|uniref:Uncharacterized protein n=1 Tax=Cymbomonas tetramitiformis TaxID=36881 RepID=A0AAE0L3T3_9CHLO|nr:hypothetical protein CYMTET_20890 [Cymbomonas tetramitiformis]
MPPKNKSEAGPSKEVSEAVEENKRLVRAAFRKKMFSDQPCTTSVALKPTQAISSSDNKDIVKKSVSRKNRYLFAMPGCLAPCASGPMGHLSQLDTQNPILYIEFPQGRLKCFGTIVHSLSKYLCLNFAKKHILCESFEGIDAKGSSSSRRAPLRCLNGGKNHALHYLERREGWLLWCYGGYQDVFDSLVVFSEFWWIGTKETNPEERQLKLPPFLHDEKSKLHQEPVLWQAGAGALATDSAAPTSVKQSKLSPTEKMEVDDAQDPGMSSRLDRDANRKRRASAGSKKYAVDGSSEEEDDAAEAEDKEEDAADVKTGEREEGSDGDSDDSIPLAKRARAAPSEPSTAPRRPRRSSVGEKKYAVDTDSEGGTEIVEDDAEEADCKEVGSTQEAAKKTSPETKAESAKKREAPKKLAAEKSGPMDAFLTAATKPRRTPSASKKPASATPPASAKGRSSSATKSGKKQAGQKNEVLDLCSDEDATPQKRGQGKGSATAKPSTNKSTGKSKGKKSHDESDPSEEDEDEDEEEEEEEEEDDDSDFEL